VGDKFLVTAETAFGAAIDYDWLYETLSDVERAQVSRATDPRTTSAGLAAARAEGRVGGRRKKLHAAKQPEIAKSVISGRKTGAEMARLYNVSAPTVSRIVSAHRTGSADTNHAVR
jgi:DNA invertase Pin-like site-specific DNA recombinase